MAEKTRNLVIRPTDDVLTDEAVDTLADILLYARLKTPRIELDLTGDIIFPPSLIYRLAWRLSTTYLYIWITASQDRLDTLRAARLWHTRPTQEEKDNAD